MIMTRCRDVHFRISAYSRIILDLFFEFQNISRISNSIANIEIIQFRMKKEC